MNIIHNRHSQVYHGFSKKSKSVNPANRQAGAKVFFDSPGIKAYYRIPALSSSGFQKYR
jgi:hypothetical protein